MLSSSLSATMKPTTTSYKENENSNLTIIGIKYLEYGFLLLFIVLSSHNLYTHWGKPQGFDWPLYLQVFNATHWFKALPQIHDFAYSYHPPLSYLLQRIIHKIIRDPYTSAQLLSWLSITGGLLLLRASLKYIGLLKDTASIGLFYCFASLPILVFLTTAITNDTVSFFWFTCSLYLSVNIFWSISHTENLKHLKTLKPSILLTLSIAAGLMTKYTGLLSCAIPFFIILIRQTGMLKWHRGKQALIITIAAILLVLPFYYIHYYRPSEKPFPVSMVWEAHHEYQSNIDKRNQNKLAALQHLLRIPSNARTSWEQSTPIEDSFFHSIWLQIFKRDQQLSSMSLIKQLRLSTYFSNLYGIIFIPITLIGTIIFFIGYHKRPATWNHLGWLLLFITLLYSAGQIDFAWQYPVWSWRVIKAKYMLPALFWLSYCFGLLIYHLRLTHPNPTWHKLINSLAIATTLIFMTINYSLPVY